MGRLLVRPSGTRGKVHDVTPASAGWGHVGFGLYRLAPGGTAAEATGDREAILVMVEGHAMISAGGVEYGTLGTRGSVFEKVAPQSLYVPGGTHWEAVAATDCVIAVCSAPWRGGHRARVIGPGGISLTQRGQGANTRFIHNIAMENEDYADSLLVTEVYTPQGNWSSYPPHRHDEDDFPRMTYLEETYWFRLNPAEGYGLHRVYTEDGTLDEAMVVRDGDVTLVPKGHHPVGAPYG
jgi:5-deoxy-glucuronate isomerase